ncbi:hypothetical protein Bca101_057586 [Brassica carinata]
MSLMEAVHYSRSLVRARESVGKVEACPSKKVRFRSPIGTRGVVSNTEKTDKNENTDKTVKDKKEIQKKEKKEKEKQKKDKKEKEKEKQKNDKKEKEKEKQEKDGKIKKEKLFQLVNTMEFPRSMFSDKTRPAPTTEIQYGSTFKALKAVKNVVGVDVWEHVENSPLGPARFSIFEFKDITGLNWDTIPNTKVVGDVEESNRFWGLFNLRSSRSTSSDEDIIALCQSSDVCSSWTREDKIRLCYLAILTGGLLGHDRRQAIPPAKANLLIDLETIEQYPWGRVAFVEFVHQVKEETECRIMKNSYVCKGFVQVLQVWDYAYIPFLGEEIGHPIRSNGPCLLRFKGMCGSSTSSLSVLCAREAEMKCVHCGNNKMWILRLTDFSSTFSKTNLLRSIAWQALPKYPLTPIQCNKRSAGQKKSKKSKTDAREGQENIAVRKTPEERFDMERLECLYETTLQNLEDRVDALELMGRRADKVLEMVSRLVSIEEAS